MKTNKGQAYTVAFCSLMAALGAVLMLTGGLIPVMTYCSPLMAGVLLIPVLREFGKKWAWLVWLVTALRWMRRPGRCRPMPTRTES